MSSGHCRLHRCSHGHTVLTRWCYWCSGAGAFLVQQCSILSVLISYLLIHHFSDISCYLDNAEVCANEFPFVVNWWILWITMKTRKRFIRVIIVTVVIILLLVRYVGKWRYDVSFVPFSDVDIPLSSELESVWFVSGLYAIFSHWLRYCRRYCSLPATVRLRYRQDLTVPYSRRGYGAVNTISFSLSVTRLVLTPALTLNDSLSQNFTTKWHWHFKTTESGNEMNMQITIDKYIKSWRYS